MVNKPSIDESKEKELLRPRKMLHGVPHERSKKLQDFKKRHGLPKWSDVQKVHDLGLVDEVERKLRNMERFAVANQVLFEQIHAAGWSEANLIHHQMDLQNRLWELEEQLIAEGKNPLESKEWMDARRDVVKEQQAIQKLNLDIAKFFSDERKTKEKTDDDSLFVVEKEEGD